MKKNLLRLFTVLITVFSLVFFGCNLDDESPGSGNNPNGNNNGNSNNNNDNNNNNNNNNNDDNNNNDNDNNDNNNGGDVPQSSIEGVFDYYLIAEKLSVEAHKEYILPPPALHPDWDWFYNFMAEWEYNDEQGFFRFYFEGNDFFAPNDVIGTVAVGNHYVNLKVPQGETSNFIIDVKIEDCVGNANQVRIRHNLFPGAKLTKVEIYRLNEDGDKNYGSYVWDNDNLSGYTLYSFWMNSTWEDGPLWGNQWWWDLNQAKDDDAQKIFNVADKENSFLRMKVTPRNDKDTQERTVFGFNDKWSSPSIWYRLIPEPVVNSAGIKITDPDFIISKDEEIVLEIPLEVALRGFTSTSSDFVVMANGNYCVYGLFKLFIKN